MRSVIINRDICSKSVSKCVSNRRCYFGVQNKCALLISPRISCSRFWLDDGLLANRQYPHEFHAWGFDWTMGCWRIVNIPTNLIIRVLIGRWAFGVDLILQQIRPVKTEEEIVRCLITRSQYTILILSSIRLQQ